MIEHATSDQLAKERQFMERFNLKRSTARACLQKVAGGRCPEPHANCDGCPFPTGHTGGRFEWWDHVCLYRGRSHDRYMLLAQPYDLHGGKLAKVLDSADRFNLDVTVLPGSGWWDERTVGVLFTWRKSGARPA